MQHEVKLIKHGVKNGFIIGFTLVFSLSLLQLLNGEIVAWDHLTLMPLFYGAIGAVVGLVVEVVINHIRLHSPPKEELPEEEDYEEEDYEDQESIAP